MRRHNSQKVNELVWYQNDGQCGKRNGKRINYLWSTIPERRHDEIIDQLAAHLHRVIRYSRKNWDLQDQAKGLRKVIALLMDFKKTRFGQVLKKEDQLRKDVETLYEMESLLHRVGEELRYGFMVLNDENVIKTKLAWYAFNRLRGCLVFKKQGFDVFKAYKDQLEYRDDCEVLFGTEMPLLYVKEN